MALWLRLMSDLPFDNTTQILCGVEVRSVNPSNTMVTTPVTSSFGSVGRCQVLLTKGNPHLHKACQPKEAVLALSLIKHS